MVSSGRIARIFGLNKYSRDSFSSKEARTARRLEQRENQFFEESKEQLYAAEITD